MKGGREDTVEILATYLHTSLALPPAADADQCPGGPARGYFLSLKGMLQTESSQDVWQYTDGLKQDHDILPLLPVRSIQPTSPRGLWGPPDTGLVSV